MKDLRNEEIESTCHCELESSFSKYGGNDLFKTLKTLMQTLTRTCKVRTNMCAKDLKIVEMFEN
jgi:hypothetical protein